MNNQLGLRKLNTVSEKFRAMLLEDLENGRILTQAVTHCACCGDNDFEKLLVVDRFDLPFASVICRNCGLVSTTPYIKQESLEYYYDKYYHPLNYGKEELEEQGSLYDEGQGEKIFSRIQPHLNKKHIEVLEIGAGVGDVLLGLVEGAKEVEINLDVLGTEYSQQCIEKCNTLGVNTIFGDAQTVLDLEKTFDVIILSHVFEHLIDLKAELKRLAKLLNSDGIVYLEVPGIYRNHTKAYYDFSFQGYSVHAHIYNFTLATLENSVGDSGFALIEGSEEVYGIFKLSDAAPKPMLNEYRKIKHYLEFLDQNQEFANARQQSIDFLENRIRAINKTVDSRGEVIVDLKEEIAEFKRETNTLSKENRRLDKVLDLRTLEIEKRTSELKQRTSELKQRTSELKQQQDKNTNLDQVAQRRKGYLEAVAAAKREVAESKLPFGVFKKLKAYKKLLKVIDATKA